MDRPVRKFEKVCRWIRKGQTNNNNENVRKKVEHYRQGVFLCFTAYKAVCTPGIDNTYFQFPAWKNILKSKLPRLSFKMENGKKKLLIIEPFYGGSHKKLIDIICSNISRHIYTLISMTAKKWHWRARTCALYISMQIPHNHNYEVLLCTSVLPLAELLGLRPDLVGLRKAVYFHENQLEFPVRLTKERDFQYGFNEILSCLAADKVLFNSHYNQESFLSHINSHLKLQPDYKVKNLDQLIRSKCQVIHYPLDICTVDVYLSSVKKEDRYELHILWPHRWEFDKNPEAFYRVLCTLDENGHAFKVSILGESFSEKPEIFNELTHKFNTKLLHCGYIDSAAEYYKVLKNSDVVVSTAIHEFFGVAILEAVYCGCIPVVPNRLSYKELYEGKVDEMYNTENELYEILANLCNKKQNGSLCKSYKYLALPFESTKWIKTLEKIIL